MQHEPAIIKQTRQVTQAETERLHAATVETLEYCRTDFISREGLVKLMDRNEEAVFSIAQALSRKLSSVVAHTRLLLLSQSATEKLARLLITWAEERGTRTSNGTRVDLGLTHEEIAQMIGSSRETVTRVIAELKRKQIVSLTDNAILVRDKKALQLAAGW